jgi:hypothetical protein
MQSTLSTTLKTHKYLITVNYKHVHESLRILLVQSRTELLGCPDSLCAAGMCPGTAGWSGMDSRNLSKWSLNVSAVVSRFLISRGNELKSLGPSDWKDWSLKVLTALNLSDPGSEGIEMVRPLRDDAGESSTRPQNGTKPLNTFQE